MSFPAAFHARAFGNKDNALPRLGGSEFSVLKEHAVYLQSNALGHKKVPYHPAGIWIQIRLFGSL